jgi:hypothetical protein
MLGMSLSCKFHRDRVCRVVRGLRLPSVQASACLPACPAGRIRKLAYFFLPGSINHACMEQRTNGTSVYETRERIQGTALHLSFAGI